MATRERHGLSRTNEYFVWRAMRHRCFSPTNKWYWLYGANGVTVCERWKNSFLNFLADMGRRPSPKHSIDRFPDPYGNYEPGNCRWATTHEQATNRRTRTHCLKGHAFTKDNIYIVSGHRTCLTCFRENGKKYHLKNKEKRNRYCRERYRRLKDARA